MRRPTFLIALMLITAVAPAQFPRFFRSAEPQNQAPAASPAASVPTPEPQPEPTPRVERNTRAQATTENNRRSETAKPATSTRSRSSNQESTTKKATSSSSNKKDSAKASSSKSEEAEATVKQLEPTKEEKEMIAAQKELLKAADQATTVVADFLKYAQNGSYSKAAELLTGETQSYFKSDLSAIYGNLKLVLDQITRSGDIRAVTYSSVSVRGEGAHVDAEISYRSGAMERRAFDLIKVQNNWRISMPVGPQALAFVQTAASQAIPSSVVAAAAQEAPPAASPAPADSITTSTESPVAAESSRPQDNNGPIAAVFAPQTIAATQGTPGPNEGTLPKAVTVPVSPVEQPTENLPISISSSPSPAGSDQGTTPSALSDAPWGSRQNP